MGWAFNWAVEPGPAYEQIGSSKCRQTDARKLGVALYTGKSNSTWINFGP